MRDDEYAKKLKPYNLYYCKACKNTREAKGTIPIKNTGIHTSFMAAKDRCNNKNAINYFNYGGRGIKMLWKNFNEFYKDMHSTWYSGATIDRIDSNGDYCKDNCRWATMAEQARNTRRNKHTVEQVKKMREMYASGLFTQKDLTVIFNDSSGNISSIINNKTWKGI